MSLEKELTIRNKMGMHARPAAQFVKRASKYQSDGVDAEAAMADLEELVSSGFGDVE
jgi:phosphocarrier protein